MQKAVVVGLLLILVGAAGYLYYKSRNDLVGQFNVTSDKIASDLEGRTAPLPYGQVWPFEPNQGLTVKIVGKKQVDDYVQVVIEVSAQAKVEPPKTDKKEEKPPPVKSFKVALTGLAKLTYERVGTEWYIVGVDSLSLRAHPLIEPADTKKQ